MKSILIIYLIFLAQLSFAQSEKNETDKNEINTQCWKFNKKCALKDINNSEVVLLLQSGISPIQYSADLEFSKKYNISFFDLGCTSYDSKECLISYNKTVFNFLDKTYGKVWRTEVRKDVIGFKNN